MVTIPVGKLAERALAIDAETRKQQRRKELLALIVMVESWRSGIRCYRTGRVIDDMETYLAEWRKELRAFDECR